MQPELSIVVPLKNEAAHVVESLGKIRAAAEKACDPVEVLAVDDGSDDGTWERLTELRADWPGLRALRLSRSFGKELALCAGLERARGRAVLVMDGDLQHPPHLISELVHGWRDEGYDVVEGVKEAGGEEDPLVHARAGLFYGVLNRLSGLSLHHASDFKLMDRKVVEAWTKLGERQVFFRGMSAWLGFKRKEVPFRVEERAGGETSWSTLGLFKLAVDGVTSFSVLPLHLITTMGLVFLVFALILGANSLIQKLSGVALTGFTTVILLQLIIGSMLMVGLGILGQYVARIYEEVKGRPRYVVSEEAGEEG